jgi:hypothetical protein
LYASPTGVFSIWDDLTNPPDPTGATDSSKAFIYAAMQAANNDGGIVLVPPGTYMIAYTIPLADGVVGCSQGDTVITAGANLQWFVGGAYTTVMVTNSFNIPGSSGAGNQQQGISVRDITFNGNGTNQMNLDVGNSGAILEFDMCVDITIERCTIYNCQNHAIVIDYIDNESGTPTPGNIKILDNTIDVMATLFGNHGKASGSLSIRVTSYYNVIIRNNVLGYNPQPGWTPLWANDGIDTLHCSDVTISGNQITYVTDGIGCDYGDNVVITDNIVENYQGFGIRSEMVSNGYNAISNLLIANNVVKAALAGTAFVSKAGIVASAGLPSSGTTKPTSWHYSIANNTVQGPTGNGAINCNAPGGSCTGNSVDLNTTNVTDYGSQYGIYVKESYITIRGNQVFDSNPESPLTGVGIELLSDNDNLNTVIAGVVIDANAVTDTSVAIWLHTNIQDISVTDNNLIGNSTGVMIPTTHTVSDLRIAGNLGENPPAISAFTQPTFPSATNTTGFDCMVSVAGLLTDVQVNGKYIAWPPSGTSVTGPITVKVPVNGSIAVSGSGSWYWTPQ